MGSWEPPDEMVEAFARALWTELNDNPSTRGYLADKLVRLHEEGVDLRMREDAD